MALFNKFVLKDFTKERYLALANAYPRLKEEKTQIYLMLSLTFISLSFLGIFAINPTLTTIVELNKKLDDSIFVSHSLETKIENLSSLNTQYEYLSDTWPLVNRAIPGTPQVVPVLGQIQTIAKNNNVTLTDLQSYQVDLTKNIIQSKYIKAASFVFSATVTGPRDNLLQFVKAISRFDRVIAIESINFLNEGSQSVTIRAQAFFIP